MVRMKDYPKVEVFGYDEEHNKKMFEIQQLIKDVNVYNGTSKDNVFWIKIINERLTKLSNGRLSVRYWCVDDTLNCIVIYPNEYGHYEIMNKV